MDWSAEPDLEALRRLHALLGTHSKQAIPGLEDLARQGSAMSALYLGEHYAKSSPPDDAAAARWYRTAHELGLVQASHLLGRVLHREGDFAGAFAAFSAGAAKFYLPAMYQAAKMHQSGEGVPVDLPECISLLQQAEARGHVFARRDLATLMISGKLGPACVAPGAVMMAKVGVDIARLVGKGGRADTLQDERIIA